jgi:hypothetical protein
MAEIHVRTALFEGEPLSTLTRDGTPAWGARQVGRHLGYGGRGADLIREIRGPWAPEMLAGVHFDRLTPSEHNAVDGMFAHAGLRPLGDDPIVLYLAGLRFVTGRTAVPVASRLIRFVRVSVLPQLARDPRGAPTFERLVGSLRSPSLERVDRVIDLLDRHMQVTALHRAVDRAGSVLGEAGCAAMEILAAEIATREDLRAAVDLAEADATDPAPAA